MLWRGVTIARRSHFGPHSGSRMLGEGGTPDMGHSAHTAVQANTLRHAAITGWGMAVPKRVLSNADLERMVETSDDWITSRTGIKERRVVGPEDSTTSLSVIA